MVTTDGRPPILSPRFDSMPEQLQAIPAWVVWRAEFQPDKGKYSKIPIDAKWGDRDRPGSSTNVATWADFETARRCYERHRGHFAGVGFVVSDSDPYVGIDFDHVIENRVVRHDVAETVAAIASYTEVSPSGTGLRIFVRATLPPEGRKRGDIELYESGRFLTVTGRRLPGTPEGIEDRQAEVERFHASVWPIEPPRERSRSYGGGGQGLVNAADCDILSRAFQCQKNGGEIAALYGGSTEAYRRNEHTGRSEGDMALACYLAFWTGPHPDVLDRLMRNSGLMRDKWDEVRYANGDTYGGRIVRRAIEQCKDFYKQEQGRGQEPRGRISRPGEFDRYRRQFLREQDEPDPDTSRADTTRTT